MSNPDAPKIEFPCKDYPVKVMGEAGAELHKLVVLVMSKYDPSFDADCIKTKDSSKGRFQSLTVLITATGVEQLSALHQELIASPLVKMVL